MNWRSGANKRIIDRLIYQQGCWLLEIDKHSYINPAPAGGGEGGRFDLPVVFPKMYLLDRGWSPGFFWLLYYHKSHLFWEFHWNSSSCSEDTKILNIHNFKDFSTFLTLPCYKETNDVAYNRWCQFSHKNILSLWRTKKLYILEGMNIVQSCI